MLLQTIEALFRKYRLFCYQKLFAAVRDFDARFAAKKQERKLLEFSANIL